jgi:hypothetical protein
MKNVLMTALVLCALESVGSPAASLNQWTSIGPDGGTVLAVAIDPANPSIMYAGAVGGGIFKTTDAGRHWAAVNAGLDYRNSIVNAIVIDPIIPSSEGRIQRSR